MDEIKKKASTNNSEALKKELEALKSEKALMQGRISSLESENQRLKFANDEAVEILNEHKELEAENERLKGLLTQESEAKTHFIDLACFEYIGEANYLYKDEKGRSYELKKGDLLYLSDDEKAGYLRYKKTLFKEKNV